MKDNKYLLELYNDSPKTIIFQNVDCKFFPCHFFEKPDDFNCKFCYCPLYWIPIDCKGNYKSTKTGIKDCSDCIIPHNGLEGAIHIDNVLSSVMKSLSLFDDLYQKR